MRVIDLCILISICSVALSQEAFELPSLKPVQVPSKIEEVITLPQPVLEDYFQYANYLQTKLKLLKTGTKSLSQGSDAYQALHSSAMSGNPDALKELAKLNSGLSKDLKLAKPDYELATEIGFYLARQDSSSSYGILLLRALKNGREEQVIAFSNVSKTPDKLRNEISINEMKALEQTPEKIYQSYLESKKKLLNGEVQQPAHVLSYQKLILSADSGYVPSMAEFIRLHSGNDLLVDDLLDYKRSAWFASRLRQQGEMLERVKAFFVFLENGDGTQNRLLEKHRNFEVEFLSPHTNFE